VVPDILANSGGVCVSYLEWLQALRQERWGDDDVRTRMRVNLHEAFERVVDEARELDVSWRTAALTAAVGRVASVTDACGVYP
jgi:glutamate dehydrogenase (NAD(P)+)